MDELGAIVIGAGVVGLAVARALALAGHEVLVLEAEDRFGSATSSRNSEVIHAGLYYPPGSLKAELCVEGRERLYAFCAERGVPHRQCGKLIFAHEPAQSVELDAIAATAAAAGVTELERLDAAAVRRLEPELRCAEALLSPRTGILDSHAYMLALLAEAEAHGAVLACRAAVERVTRRGGLWLAHAGGTVVAAPRLVNAAGLAASEVAGRIEGLATADIPPIRYAKGVYFSYSGRAPFTHLIYPAPEPGGLGTHLTLDLAGQVRFGPDVEWVDHVDYAVDPGRKRRFVAAARRIWPALDPERLAPGYAGVRPKLSAPGEPAADFHIDGSERHGHEGLVNLFGIESPGLTASLAIAERVCARLS